jgi:hypothetical protein
LAFADGGLGSAFCSCFGEQAVIATASNSAVAPREASAII